MFESGGTEHGDEARSGEAGGNHDGCLVPGGSFGSKLAGYLSGFYVPQAGTLVKLYGAIAVGLLISAGLLALLTPRVKKLMGTVN